MEWVCECECECWCQDGGIREDEIKIDGAVIACSIIIY